MFGKKKSSDKKRKHFKMPKWLIVTLIIVLILAIAGGAYFLFGRNKAEKTSANASTYTVTRGNIAVTITGSGAIEPNDQYTITPLVKGEIISSNFEEGDLVKKGDVMYVIDSSDQETNVKKAENSLKQAQDSLSEAKEGYDDLTVVSEVGGMVTAVYVEKGDNVGANAKILDIVNNEYMTLVVPFNVNDAMMLRKGDNATVNLEGQYYTMSGTVSYVSQGSNVTAEGVEVRNVEIEVKNPGAIQAGDKATAIIGDYACNQAGAFESSETVSIMSKTSGKVAYQPFRVGDVISSGNTVLQIDTKDVDKQVKNAQMNFDNAELSYINTLDQLDNYTITAPIEGTVIQKNSKAGDKLDNGTASVSMAVIADMSRMTFDISIDELDIQLLEVGQKAVVTSDAFEDQVFSGTVDYISVIGTTSNGVTTYPVTIVLDDAGELLPGMNVDATITVKESINTLMVPVDAVQRNNIVYVKDDGVSSEDEIKSGDGEAQQKMPEGASGTQRQKPTGANGEMPQRGPGNSPGVNGGMSNRPEGANDAQRVPGAPSQTQQSSAVEEQVKKPSADSGSSSDKPSEKTNTPVSNTKPNADKNIAPKVQQGGKTTAGVFKGSRAPEGFKAVQVTLGINNDSFIEILSGLKEGDVVYVQSSTRASSNQQFMMPGGMPGGMGGGMPSRMPSGGMGGGMPAGGMGGMSGGSRQGGGMMR